MNMRANDALRGLSEEMDEVSRLRGMLRVLEEGDARRWAEEAAHWG